MQNQIIPNPIKISELVEFCSFNPDQDVTIGIIPVEGVVKDFIFDPDKLESRKAEILEQIDGLPAEFSEGWSFLQACMNKEGIQWGGHKEMEELMVLGIAIGKIEICLPRALWMALPGGMPYFQVK